MRRLLQVAMVVTALFFTTGCIDVKKLAEKILYPFSSVDKKYPVPENPPEGLYQTYFELEDTEGEEMLIHAWFRKSNQDKVIVYFHGNGTNLEVLYQASIIRNLEILGFDFVIIDYPGLGRSVGTPNEPNLVSAGVAAVEFAREIFPDKKITLWGRSLGAAVAAQVAVERQDLIDNLMLTSPWASFIELALEKTGLARKLPKEWLDYHGYNSVGAAEEIGLRTLIHHGNEDKVIPFKFGQMVYEALASEDVHFVELEEVGHNDIFAHRKFWDDLKEFHKE